MLLAFVQTQMCTLLYCIDSRLSKTIHIFEMTIWLLLFCNLMLGCLICESDTMGGHWCNGFIYSNWNNAIPHARQHPDLKMALKRL